VRPLGDDATCGGADPEGPGLTGPSSGADDYERIDRRIETSPRGPERDRDRPDDARQQRQEVRDERCERVTKPRPRVGLDEVRLVTRTFVAAIPTPRATDGLDRP
jgi:hypothetical protein